MVGVDEVESDCFVPYPRLAGSRFANRYFFPAHLFRSTGPMNANGKRHGEIPPWLGLTV
jgi:hypothetical protein